jgi:hypothetical protein
MTSGQTGEPDLAEVQHEYPAWRCARGISGLYYAHNPTIGVQVQGEDPLDLRDQIKAAQAHHDLLTYTKGQPCDRPRLM